MLAPCYRFPALIGEKSADFDTNTKPPAEATNAENLGPIKKRKRRKTLPIDVDPDSENEMSRGKKPRSERMTVAGANLECGHINPDLQREENLFKSEEANRAETEAARRREALMKKADHRRLQLEIQLETMRQRSMILKELTDGSQGKMLGVMETLVFVHSFHFLQLSLISAAYLLITTCLGI